MNLQNYYYYFQSALTPRICDDIIAYAKQHKPEMAVTGGIERENGTSRKKDGTYKKTTLKKLHVKRKSDIVWLNDTWIYKELHPYVHQANEKAGWNFKLTTSESAQFTIYDNEQHYWWHKDARQYPYYDNDFPNLIRKLSVTVSLSHPKEYEGGYLEFSATRDWGDSFKTQCTEILPRGSICVFPSYTWHRVSPVTKGRRLSLVQWNLGEGYV